MTTGRQGTILVVDDEEIMREILETLLTREGYDVRLASSGTEGLDLARTLPFDAAIVDIMMPGLDGIQACHRIRSNPATHEVPILIFTALSEEGEAARLAGADGLLKKPFSLLVLGQTVRRLCRG